MKASLLYRFAAVLLVLFAAGHTLGFRQSDPAWGVDALLASMRSIHFDLGGFSRTYWEQDPLEVAKAGLAKMKAVAEKALLPG